MTENSLPYDQKMVNKFQLNTGRMRAQYGGKGPMTAGQPYTFGLTSSRENQPLSLPDIGKIDSKETLTFRE